MIMKRLLFILLPFLALFLLNSCDKQNIEDLQGSWELVSKSNNDFDYKWTFKDSKVTIESIDNKEPFDGSFDICNSGNYFVKNGVLTIATTEEFCNYSFYAGDWDIQKLEQEYLTLRRNPSDGNSGTLWYEFVKITN